MPPSVPRPSAVLALSAALVTGLLGTALPAAPASAASGSLEPAFRVASTEPLLVPRLKGPATTLPPVAAADTTRAQRTSAPRSSWVVTYDAGFNSNPRAKAEFQRAVDTWAEIIGSRVPITVKAEFKTLDPRLLGQAGPGGFVEEVPDDRYQAGERIFPVALGNAMAGRDLITPGQYGSEGFDIEAEFPNRESDIFYGPGPVPAGKYDFYSTVLHEIGHGLGFGSGFRYSDSDGTGGYVIRDYLIGYDRFLTLGTSGTNDLFRIPRGTTQLGSGLVSGNLFWRGPQGVAANGGTRPKMWAPGEFAQGSSLSHLDERAYPPGTLNALMTPQGAPGEQNTDVGPLATAMLADLGWSVSGAAPSGSPSPSPSPSPSASQRPSTSPSPSPAPVAGSRFTPLTPERLLDTRTGLGLSGPVRLGDADTVDLTVVGGSTGVPAGATAVVLNVTAVGATRATDVRVYPKPADDRVPTVSNINLKARETRAGLVTVPVGADGQVRLRNEDGQVSLLADLAGFYAPDAQTAFHPVDPVRLLDTRTRTPRKLGPGATLDLVVAGARGVPASAAAVVLNVTGVAPTASTDLAVYPATSSTAKPETSNINLVPGVPVPNLVVVKVGDGGKVRIRNSSGTTAVLVDLSGWYDATAADGQLFRPVAPVRLFDTRQADAVEDRRLPAGARGIYRAKAGPAALPSSATAALLNVTGIAASAATDLRTYPLEPGDAVPVVSNLNLGRGSTNANAVVVRLGEGDGGIVFRNQSGSVALLSDLAGYFAP